MIDAAAQLSVLIRGVCFGVSLNASQTQNGASGASWEPIKAVLIAGSKRAPRLNRVRPTAELTKSNRLSGMNSLPETASGSPKGQHTSPVSRADRQAAGMAGMLVSRLSKVAHLACWG